MCRWEKRRWNDVVHYAEDRIVAELSNGSVSTGDSNPNVQKFQRENDVAVDGIEKQDE